MFPSSNYYMHTLLIIILYLICAIIWKRRHLYFCSWKLPGPLSFPLVGSIYLCFKWNYKEAYDAIVGTFNQYSPICKIWLGPYLVVATSRPEDAEVILPKCLDKGVIHFYAKDSLKQSLIISPLDVWKKRRKIINPTFNTNIINAFVPIMNKHSHLLGSILEKNCHPKDTRDVFPTIWKFTLDITCETLCSVNPNLIKNKELFLDEVLRSEEMLVERFTNPLLHIPLIWRFSTLRKTLLKFAKNASDFADQLIKLNYKTSSADKKPFLSHLVDLHHSNKLSYDGLLEEVTFMLIASSETIAVTISYLLLIMGFDSNIQEKIYEEVYSICGNSLDVSLNDLNRMEYLERVIKETMRLFPGGPFIERTLDKDVFLEDIVLPKDTIVLFLISEIHRRAEIWPEPLKFNPDRFLAEEVKKRHRCSYIPFSFGPRNCIGGQYAMISMKIILAKLFLAYKVQRTVDYRRLEDIKQTFQIVTKAKNGFRVVLEKRSNNKNCSVY